MKVPEGVCIILADWIWVILNGFAEEVTEGDIDDIFCVIDGDVNFVIVMVREDGVIPAIIVIEFLVTEGCGLSLFEEELEDG